MKWREKKNIGTSSIGKKIETRKPIDQPILEQIDQHIFEQIKQVESQVVTKTFETDKTDMAQEGKWSNILTPEQRLQYEKQQKEWERRREEVGIREAERKREEDAKR